MTFFYSIISGSFFNIKYNIINKYSYYIARINDIRILFQIKTEYSFVSNETHQIWNLFDQTFQNQNYDKCSENIKRYDVQLWENECDYIYFVFNHRKRRRLRWKEWGPQYALIILWCIFSILYIWEAVFSFINPKPLLTFHFLISLALYIPLPHLYLCLAS